MGDADAEWGGGRRYEIVPLFTDIARHAAKEKVTRVIMATLRVSHHHVHLHHHTILTRLLLPFRAVEPPRRLPHFQRPPHDRRQDPHARQIPREQEVVR